MEKSVKIGELEIPANYWSLDTEEKRALCLTIIDGIMTLLDKQIAPELNRIMIMKTLLQSSLETNLNDENYEICQVLYDIQSILNE